MSPYLLAFIISDFDFSSFKVGPTLHRIYTRPDNDATFRTQFALTNSDLLLKELERYVSHRYELNKLDQAALPDFQSGSCLHRKEKL
jgi:aminopeptidase N